MLRLIRIYGNAASVAADIAMALLQAPEHYDPIHEPRYPMPDPTPPYRSEGA